MYLKDKAFVLIKKDAPEASNFYILYTEKKGLQKVIVRGAKKSLSKMAGHLEPPALAEIFMAQGKQINYVVGASLIKRFELSLLEKYRLQFFAAKLILQLIKENNVDSNLWILLNNFYKLLEKLDNEKNLELLKNIFLWQLGEALGFKVLIDKCLLCQGVFNENNYLDFENGGIICEHCFKKNQLQGLVKKISPQIIKILRFIQSKKEKELFEIKIGNDFLNEFEKLSKEFWEYRFEIQI